MNEPEAMLERIESGADKLITDKLDILHAVVEIRARLIDPEKVALRLRVLFGAGGPIDSARSSKQ